MKCIFLDPSLPAGKRREIDNVMKKARANTNDYWDKKLLEVEEKDPNRWRHTGYKKMYIQGESSSGESDREAEVGGGSNTVCTNGSSGYRYSSTGGQVISGCRYGRSRSPLLKSNSRLRKTPPLSPPARRRSPPSSRDVINRISRSRISPPSSLDGPVRGARLRSPAQRGRTSRSPSELSNRRQISGGGGGRPRSPLEPSRSPADRRRGSPTGASGTRRRNSPANTGPVPSKQRGIILPRSKRPPSPPPGVSYDVKPQCVRKLSIK